MTEPLPVVLVMAKAPVPGLVKTRLEPLLGPHGCAALQVELLRTVVATALAGGFPTLVATTPQDALDDVGRLLPAHVAVLAQSGGDLGQRMRAAVLEMAAGSADPARGVLVVGTDVPTLTPETFRCAAAGLTDHDVVLGPALDGGYYLVGLRAPQPEVFDLPPSLWGGPQVLSATLQRCTAAGLTVRQLPPHRDLDTPADAAALGVDPRVPEPVRRLLQPEVVA